MSTELKAIQYGLQRTIYKKSLYDFFVDAVKILEPSTEWDYNWHIKYLCDVLQKDAYRLHNKHPRDTNGSSDKIINIPFRSAKSLIFSVIFPAWLWTWYPEAKIITISYAESLAVKQSYLSKILIYSEWYKNYFPEVMLMRDDSGKGHYRNVTGGFRAAIGLVGAITGDGADFIIVDDPNKPTESKKQLVNANSTFDEVIYNRLNNPEYGQRYVIQQRISQNDLSGHLIKKGGEWETICIPAELGTNLYPPSLVEKYVNGLFWNSRFSKKILNQFKINLGTRGYNSQLNQRTKDDGGNILKKDWFQIKPWDSKYESIEFNMYVDSAYTADSANDPSAIMIAGKQDNCLIVRKVIVAYKEFPDLIKLINTTAINYNIKRIKIEPKASGKSVVQQLRVQTKHSVSELKIPQGDKETKCNAISPVVESKRVILIEDNWNDDFVEECTEFPNGTHDDQLDDLVFAINDLLMGKKFSYSM